MRENNTVETCREFDGELTGSIRAPVIHEQYVKHVLIAQLRLQNGERGDEAREVCRLIEHWHDDEN
jgi:hypothetical protein